MGLAAGRLKQQVQILSRSIVADSFGAETETWTVSATVFGEFLPTRGKEAWAASQLIAESTAKVTIRYRSGVDAAKRLRVAGSDWDILSVANLTGKNELLEIYCREARPK